jgi:hypothetical protein
VYWAVALGECTSPTILPLSLYEFFLPPPGLTQLIKLQLKSGNSVISIFLGVHILSAKALAFSKDMVTVVVLPATGTIKVTPVRAGVYIGALYADMQLGFT